MSNRARDACRVERFAQIEAGVRELRDQVKVLRDRIASQEARLAAVEAAQARAGRFSPATGLPVPGDAAWDMASAGTQIVLVPSVAGVRLS